MTESFGKELLIKSGLLEILAHIINTKQYMRISSMNKLGSGTASAAVELVLKYIEEHYKENITLEALLD